MDATTEVLETAVEETTLVPIKDIEAAADRLEGIVVHTPLMRNLNFSDKFGANIYFKREDLQAVRSYKIRGAYNKMSSLDRDTQSKGIVCASAGNHAQGVAYSCHKLQVFGTIFMPNTTPNQKVKQVKMFGKEFVKVELIGDSFDDAYAESMRFCEEEGATFIHPFDDNQVIQGQGTVGLEILGDMKDPIDYLFLPIGGGGLASGVLSVFKRLSPNTKVIGIEPKGAPAMKMALERDENLPLKEIDTFVDGAAVKQVGHKAFSICREYLDEIFLVPEGKICSTILQLYNEEAIIVEPAGTLSIAALDFFKEKIKGKNVVCVVSGSNNDITRTEEIKERSLLYEGLKHYFIVRFPQRAGALKEFLNDVLGEGDDIVHFEYSKKHSREKGPALIGIELKNRDHLEGLMSNMTKKQFVFEYLNTKPDLLQYLV